MRPFILLTVVLLFSVWGSFVQADDETKDAGDSKPSVASAADLNRFARVEEKRILKALSRKVTLECEDLPLNEAVFKLSEMIECEILFDALTLVDEGASMDQPVTLQLGEITAWQALHFLTKSAGLTWVANDGVLEITTKTKAKDVLVTRVYDVQRLCKLLEPYTRDMIARQGNGKGGAIPAGAAPARGGGGGGGGGHRGGGFFSIPATAIAPGAIGQFGGGGMGGMGPNGAAPPLVPLNSVEAVLAIAIMNCTGFDWLDRDGDGGSIQLGQGSLIISQAYRRHFEIAGLLETLERLADGKVRGKSVAARRTGYPYDEDAKIFETLAKPRTVIIDDETLAKVMTRLTAESGIRCWVDQGSLADEGISLDQPAGPRRKMQKLPLGICLKKILEPFLLECVVDEGVLIVTTKAVAETMTNLRLYDITGISKIANSDPRAGVSAVLSRSTHGSWYEEDGQGGAAALISVKHLLVCQTQQVHAEIDVLIDDLTRDELVVPLEPQLELHVYTVSDIETARDLERVLPQLVQHLWNPRGSIRQVGASLIISQTAAVHDRLDEIIEKLEQSQNRKNPPAKDPSDPKTPEDQQEKK